MKGIKVEKVAVSCRLCISYQNIRQGRCQVFRNSCLLYKKNTKFKSKKLLTYIFVPFNNFKLVFVFPTIGIFTRDPKDNIKF